MWKRQPTTRSIVRWTKDSSILEIVYNKNLNGYSVKLNFVYILHLDNLENAKKYCYDYMEKNP